MSRHEIIYRDGAAPIAGFAGFDADAPIAGLYKMRLRSGGVFVGISIRFGPARDPLTGEELDRSYFWHAEANGAPIDMEEVWPRCAADPIDQAEADYLATLQDWGRETGHAALADPRKRLDPLNSPLLF
jgi:hypothetical protein